MLQVNNVYRKYSYVLQKHSDVATGKSSGGSTIHLRRLIDYINYPLSRE